MTKYFSLFSGIGGFELGIGKKAKCVGYSEIDKHAISIYQKHFPKHTNYGDITKIDAETLPDFDLLVGGFPCQSFSIAGRRQGFEDTRGTLFFDIARIVRAKQPPLLLLENVKGLLSHDQGRTFTTIISALDELGYDLQWQVLNSKNFGVPQNRERVYIVGHLRGQAQPQIFPFTEDDRISEKKTGSNQGQSQAEFSTTLKASGNVKADDTFIVDVSYPSRVRKYKDTAPTVRDYGSGGNKMPMVIIPEATAKGYAEARVGDSINLSVLGSKTRRGRVGHGIAQTLDTGMQQYTLSDQGGYDGLRRPSANGSKVSPTGGLG